jgi:hypothetical protein
MRDMHLAIVSKGDGIATTIFSCPLQLKHIPSRRGLSLYTQRNRNADRPRPFPPDVSAVVEGHTIFPLNPSYVH